MITPFQGLENELLVDTLRHMIEKKNLSLLPTPKKAYFSDIAIEVIQTLFI